MTAALIILIALWVGIPLAVGIWLDRKFTRDEASWQATVDEIRSLPEVEELAA